MPGTFGTGLGPNADTAGSLVKGRQHQESTKQTELKEAKNPKSNGTDRVKPRSKLGSTE